MVMKSVSELLELCIVGGIVGVMLGFVAVPWILQYEFLAICLIIYLSVTLSWICIFVIFGSQDKDYNPKEYSLTGLLVGVSSSGAAISVIYILLKYIFVR